MQTHTRPMAAHALEEIIEIGNPVIENLIVRLISVIDEPPVRHT